MSKFTRNINDEVIVKLTPEGERVYTMNCAYRCHLNNDGVYSFQIGELINIFGKEVTINNLFVENKLVFPKKDII